MSKYTRVFVLFTAAYFLSYFFRSANAVIAPDLTRALSLRAADLGLMTSLFFAAFALSQIPLGIGLDRWGPRWVTPGLMLVGGGRQPDLCGGPHVWAAGAGACSDWRGHGGCPDGLKAFSQWFPPHRFATVSALLVGIGASGALVAASPLAWLNRVIGWRAVFVTGAVVTAAIAPAIMAWTRNTPPEVPWKPGAPDLRGLRRVFSDGRFWRIAPLNFFMTGSLLAFQGLWAGPYLFDVLGLSEIAAGNILLLLTPPAALVSLTYLLFGVTGGFSLMLLAHARHIFPPTMTGQAVTAVNLFGIGGTFLLQWWMSLIIGAFPVDAAGHYPPLAYTAALLVTGVGTGAALVWYLPLARQREPAEAYAADQVPAERR
jgi:MFS family permease